MIKILIIAGYQGINTGGSSKSLVNIINCLKETENIKIRTLTQKFKNKLLKSLELESYVLIPKIIKSILEFKPNIIITQEGMSFPTIIISKMMKIPVISIIRSTAEFCPKYVDIIGYGKACSGINNRKQCFKCINKWRTLRILIGNRSKGTEHSIRTSLISILYKIRYFVCSFNLFLIKKANINLVASDLMVEYFSNKVNKDKFKVMNITPIQKQIIEIEPKRKHLIFIRTFFETSHKGLDFIKRLSKFIPKEFWILVIGGNDVDFCKEVGYHQIVNLNHISSKEIFNEVLSESMITLVPTFCTEAFGRIIPESLVNRTPVISSPQCGANQFFNDDYYLRVVPLKLDLWIKEIKNMILNPPIINNKSINKIYKQFSLEKSKEDFIKIINEVI